MQRNNIPGSSTQKMPLFYWQIKRKWTDMATITQRYRPVLCSSPWQAETSIRILLIDFFAEDEL